MSRQVIYNVAMSLDGCIAGPGGEFDWIPMDPTIDFGSIFAGMDTVLMGRETYEVARKQGSVVPVLLGGGMPFLPSLSHRSQLRLTGTKSYPSGIVTLTYTVPRDAV